jgi:RNA-directed DNA polymerase
MAKDPSHAGHFLAIRPPITRKEVVGMRTSPTNTQGFNNGDLWINRIQERLAQRSAQGQTFNRLYDLLRDKRLVRYALDQVLSNEGARTPGIDGMTKGDLQSVEEREQFATRIRMEIRHKTYQPSPVRRVYIPKPNGDKRPLGIPTLKDRAVQEMLRLILEPIYESKFYRLSFGFRPYRSTHHAALELHWLMSRHGYNVVVEGDIRKCFDRVQHNTLLKILRRTIKDGRVIHLVGQLLKAGVMEDNAWHISDEGTPQGGIVSPLLANVYLNELDWYIAAKWDLLKRSERDKRRRSNTACPMYIVRYADDFVIAIKGSIEIGEAIKQHVAAFLEHELGLELSAEKTLVTPVENGFDFLGFTIRKFKQVTLIKPSRKAIERFKVKVRERIKAGFSNGKLAGIIYLNRYLIGWGAYYRRVSSSDTFCRLDHFVWQAVWHWAERAYGIRSRDRSKRAFYAEHRIPYRFDVYRPNRKSRSKHFGVWADEKHTLAYIVTSLHFNPIRYIKRHPQLHPYLSSQKGELARRAREVQLPQMATPDLPNYGKYGSDWKTNRKEILQQAEYRCSECGQPIEGRNATVHHKRKLKSFRSRNQANRLENLVSLCRKCHVAHEREAENRKP